MVVRLDLLAGQRLVVDRHVVDQPVEGLHAWVVDVAENAECEACETSTPLRISAAGMVLHLATRVARFEGAEVVAAM